MSGLFLPLLQSRDNWGKAETEDSREFMQGFESFSNQMTEAKKSLIAGLELRKPDKKFDLENRTIKRDDAALVAHFEGLLEEWCDHIEGYLESSMKEQYDSGNQGPLSEIEYWRRRMQKLMSITEQIKSKDVKTVVQVLSGLTKQSQDPSRGKM